MIIKTLNKTLLLKLIENTINITFNKPYIYKFNLNIQNILGQKENIYFFKKEISLFKKYLIIKFYIDFDKRIIIQNNLYYKTLKAIQYKSCGMLQFIKKYTNVPIPHKYLQVNFPYIIENLPNLKTPKELELIYQLQYKNYSKNFNKQFPEFYFKKFFNIDSLESMLEVYLNPNNSFVNSNTGIILSFSKTDESKIIISDLLINKSFYIFKVTPYNLEINTYYSTIASAGTIFSVGTLYIQNNISAYFKSIIKLSSRNEAIQYSIIFSYNLLVESLIKYFRFQQIILPNIMFEIIAKKMVSCVKILYSGKTSLLYGDIISYTLLKIINTSYSKHGLLGAFCEPIVIGITKISLINSGLLSSLSFQETIKLLSKLVLDNKIDWLVDLKSKIITSELLETGTGWYKKFLKY